MGQWLRPRVRGAIQIPCKLERRRLRALVSSDLWFGWLFEYAPLTIMSWVAVTDVLCFGMPTGLWTHERVSRAVCDRSRKNSARREFLAPGAHGFLFHRRAAGRLIDFGRHHCNAVLMLDYRGTNLWVWRKSFPPASPEGRPPVIDLRSLVAIVRLRP